MAVNSVDAPLFFHTYFGNLVRGNVLYMLRYIKNLKNERFHESFQ